MKHYRLNQIAMAVLGALLLIFGTKTLIDIAFEEHEPEKPGYEVATKQGEKAGEKPAAAAGSELPALLAKADAAKGETTAAICKACHAFEAGAPSPIGPNLHNVVGRKIASVEGFNYSPALKAHAGEVWTYEHLDAMIHKPADFAPGTLMAFPGLPDAQQRADVIAFLRTKTDNPPPLPEVVAAKEAPAEGAEAPAEGRALQGLSQLRQGRPEPDRPQSLWRRRAQDRLARRLQLFAGAEGQGKRGRLDLRASRPLADKPASLCAWNDDGVPRHSGSQNPRRRHRLPAHQVRQPGALA
jgi:cytochrome c